MGKNIDPFVWAGRRNPGDVIAHRLKQRGDEILQIVRFMLLRTPKALSIFQAESIYPWRAAIPNVREGLRTRFRTSSPTLFRVISAIS